MRLVFDTMSWHNTGDIGDNSQFWKPDDYLGPGELNLVMKRRRRELARRKQDRMNKKQMISNTLWTIGASVIIILLLLWLGSMG